jgi:Tfp pilus assembly protein PilF
MLLRVLILATAFLAGPSLSPAAAQGAVASTEDAETLQRQERLDRLFDSLRGAKGPEDAQRFEASIQQLWQRSGSDTADLLSARATALFAAEQPADAVRLLDAALEAAPDFADGWNRRATLYFLAGDTVRAMRDLRQALRYEPRHYSAWTGIGRILEQSGDNKRALEAYRRALAIHPHLAEIRTRVDALGREIRGQEL